jgi:hypothetical protein
MIRYDRRTIDLLSNIAFVIVCITLAMHVVINRRFPSAVTHVDVPPSLRTPHSPASLNRFYKSGDNFSVSNVDLSLSGVTLVLILKRDCRYCDQSIPFYRTLVKNTQSSLLRTIVLIPVDESKPFKTWGLEVDAVIPTRLTDLKVRGTPTILIIDRRGRIDRIWSGLLDERHQNEVRTAIDVAMAKNSQIAVKGGAQ